ncbi:unnamed protein product [Urochloa humidicola]
MILRRDCCSRGWPVAAADDGAGAGAALGGRDSSPCPGYWWGSMRASAPPPWRTATRRRRTFSPMSPLDLRPFATLGGSLLRSPSSPMSWDLHRLGLDGLVDDALAESAAGGGARNRLLGPRCGSRSS